MFFYFVTATEGYYNFSVFEYFDTLYHLSYDGVIIGVFVVFSLINGGLYFSESGLEFTVLVFAFSYCLDTTVELVYLFGNFFEIFFVTLDVSAFLYTFI